jgi:hypothetical protein
MDRDDSVPAFVEVAEWSRPLRQFFQLLAADKWRDGGPRDGTVSVVLIDAAGARLCLFFDKFLGRLCLGEGPQDPDAAFVKHGSELERDLFIALYTTDTTLEQRAILRAAVAHASASTEMAFRTSVALPAEQAWDELDALILKNQTRAPYGSLRLPARYSRFGIHPPSRNVLEGLLHVKVEPSASTERRQWSLSTRRTAG